MLSTGVYVRLRTTLSTGLLMRCKSRICLNETIRGTNLLVHRKWYCKGLSIDRDPSHQLSKAQERELKRIRELFPQPRVTLNELATRTPEKIFNVVYKQDIVTPKGGKRHPQDIKWICSYVFTWPEKVRFERSATSKRQAAESAAALAVQWLYQVGRMDKRGAPVLRPSELEALRAPLHQPLAASLTPQSIERIDNLWNEYNAGIKDIYEASLNEARDTIAQPAMLANDLAADEEEISGDEADTEELSMGCMHPVLGRAPQPSKAALARRQVQLEETLRRYHHEKTELPIDNYTDKILSALENNRVVIVAGSAGCGKSTRVPCALLRDGAAVLVAQPRRLAALGLAQTVATQLHDQVGHTVGYQVRLRAKFPRVPTGAILYCTTGILLRRLQENPGLVGCSAVILDEAHTREVRSDLAMALLRRALHLNTELKLLLLSATMDTTLAASYFDGCPVLQVPGRTYPVQTHHLADIQTKYNLPLSSCLQNCTRVDGRLQINCEEVAAVIKAVDKHEAEGAILVFLPGWAEIKRTKELLMKDWAQSPMHLVLPVHSRLSAEEQCKMFVRPAPGVRKVVLATDVAETSLTIPDVLHVLDSGAHRQNTLAPNGEGRCLQLCWISCASATQRAGRAGRLQPGFCYKLYTKEKEADFQAHSTPEILRVPLQQVVLECKSLEPNIPAETFFAQLPQPPPPPALEAALEDLKYLGALSSSCAVTRLGAALAGLGLAPGEGRALLLGAVLGAAPPAALLAAITHSTDLFHRPPDRREEIRAIKSKYCRWSDHVALLRILTRPLHELKAYDVATDRLDYILSVANLYLQRVLRAGILDDRCSKNGNLEDTWGADGNMRDPQKAGAVVGTLACVVSSASVLVARRAAGKMAGSSLHTGCGSRGHISTESVTYEVSKRPEAPRLLACTGGLESRERRALVVRVASLVSPHALMLFTSGDINQEPLEDSYGETTVLTIDRHKLQIHVPTSQVAALLKAHEMLWSTFQYYVERNPSTDQSNREIIAPFREALIKIVYDVITESTKELGVDITKDFDY